jgi:3-hydroxymyristoyl/3-hydroxydecanoyl-(acyl carrier protein) dehydratase
MSETAKFSETFCISAQHASLAGHFPGRPIVPGVVLLDRVAAALERSGRRLARIGVVKFVAPLLPEQEAGLEIAREGTRVRFRIDRDGAPVLVGEGELA